MKQKNWRKDDLALFVFYREKLKKNFLSAEELERSRKWPSK
jgi:hypothetical protein